jgi:3-methyl-2-oxobutanoate hydroxymethyltransferase
MPKKTVSDFRRMKEKKEKIAWMTAYDFPTAQIAEQAGLDMLLVGDSAAKVVYGYRGVYRITIDQQIYHTQAVREGAPNTFVIGDLPFLSYHRSVEEAVENAARFYREACVDAVILEGGEEIVPQVKAIKAAGMRVMGHLGLTPLSTGKLEVAEDVIQLLQDALALESAGVFAILIGFSPVEATKTLHERLKIPLIASGSGSYSDGELQAVTDILGTFPLMPSRMAARYANLGEEMLKAFKAYIADVKSGRFPGPENCIKLDSKEAARLEEMLGKNQ